MARPQLIRTLNEQLLLDRLRLAGPASRADLVEVSGLSKPTVAFALESLERAALVEPAGRRTGGRGRTAALYRLRSEAGFVLGIDVGREYVRGAVADVAGTVRSRTSRRARASSGPGRVREVIRVADELMTKAGIAGTGTVVHTVVGTPGVVDPERKALRMAAHLPGWERPGVLAALREAFGPNLAIENDVDAAAIAERDHGWGREVASFALVSVGTGIGMGLVLDGKLHRGAHAIAGEIAYLPVDGTADPREVRRRGALEAAASGDAVVRAAHAQGLRALRSARDVFEAAARGDGAAGRVVAAEVEHVARAIAAVVAIVDPDLIVLGGGIGRAAGFAEAVHARLSDFAPIVPDVRASALGDDAVVDGCLASGAEQLWEHVLDVVARD